MSNLDVTRDGSILRITLTRPDRRNAFDAALIGELAEAFVDVGRSRAVVLAGQGLSFCAGADVDWMRASAKLSYDENVADANAMRQMFESIDRCPGASGGGQLCEWTARRPAPAAGGVRAPARGGGAGLVAAADTEIGAENPVSAFWGGRRGTPPAVISPFALAKIGGANARRY